MVNATLLLLAVNINSTGFYDSDGTIVDYAWDLGDGSFSVEQNPSHTYTEPGTFIATLTVTDNDGGTGIESLVINVTATSFCIQDCLRTTSIHLHARVRNGTMSVTGKVKAHDETGANIRNADVHALWSLPDGTLQNQIVTTSISGFANFNISGSRGTYTLTVEDTTKLGMTFDIDNSVLSKSITK